MISVSGYPSNPSMPNQKVHKEPFESWIKVIDFIDTRNGKELLNNKDTFLYCHKFAVRNDPQAQYLTGLCLEKGLGTKADLKQAIKWYIQSADQGFSKSLAKLIAFATQKNPDALLYFVLFDLLCKAFQGDSEAPISLDHFASEGIPQAIDYVGFCHEFGYGTPKNIQSALTYYEKATQKEYYISAKDYINVVDQGNAYSKFLAALYLITGIGTSINIPRASDLFIQAQRTVCNYPIPFATISTLVARHLFQPILLNIALCHHYGYGTPKNTERASHYYYLLIKEGFPNPSLVYLKALADVGDDWAQERLKDLENGKIDPYEKGFSYYTALTIPEKERFESLIKEIDFIDTEKGKELLNNTESFKACYKFATLNDPQAQFLTGLCFEMGLGTETDLKQAIRWYIQAAEQGSCESIKKLITFSIEEDPDACLYFCLKNFYVKASQGDQDAFRLLYNSANQGIPQAIDYMGRCFELGYGTPVNIPLAIEYYQNATLMEYYISIKNFLNVVDQGNGYSKFLAALYLSVEFGTSKDIPRASKLFFRALDEANGDPIPLTTISTITAAHLFHPVMLNIALCHHYGCGTPKDTVRAAHFYYMLVIEGFPSPSLDHLKTLAEEGDFWAQEFLEELEHSG